MRAPILSDPALGTLPRVPSLSLSTHLKFLGSPVYEKLGFRSDVSPTVIQWTSTLLTSGAFSLDPAHSLHSLIAAHLPTPFSVAWVFHAYRLRGPWPPQAWAPSRLLWPLSRCPTWRPKLWEKSSQGPSRGQGEALKGSLRWATGSCGTVATLSAVLCSFPPLGCFLSPDTLISWLPLLGSVTFLVDVTRQ